MDLGMVIAAEDTEVVDHGVAAFGPGHEVMDVAPGRLAAAAGGNTMPVPGDDGPSETGGDDPGLSSDVEDFGVGAENDPGHRGVTCDVCPSDRLEFPKETPYGSSEARDAST